jgi:hypothetical protein
MQLETMKSEGVAQSGSQKRILAAIKALDPEAEGFYGIISFHFQNGRLTVIRREQTVMPEQVIGEDNPQWNKPKQSTD